MISFFGGHVRLEQGPIVDPNGKPWDLFWVECVGCGYEWPMKYEADLHEIVGINANGDHITPLFYVSDDCIGRAKHIIRSKFKGVTDVVQSCEVEWIQEEEAAGEGDRDAQ